MAFFSRDHMKPIMTLIVLYDYYLGEGLELLPGGGLSSPVKRWSTRCSEPSFLQV